MNVPPELGGGVLPENVTVIVFVGSLGPDQESVLPPLRFSAPSFASTTLTMLPPVFGINVSSIGDPWILPLLGVYVKLPPPSVNVPLPVGLLRTHWTVPKPVGLIFTVKVPVPPQAKLSDSNSPSSPRANASNFFCEISLVLL